MAVPDEAAKLSSVRAIAKVAIPALLLNAAAPAASAAQTALLGRLGSIDALAAYSAAGGLVGLGQRLFVFLVDGVSAKVGHSVARRRWAETTQKVNLSLAMALCCGAASAGLLATLHQPVFSRLLRLPPEVQVEAMPYFWVRLSAIPVQLLNMAMSGILQGFHHVSTTAALGISVSLIELAGSAVALLAGHGLLGVGLATLASQLLLLLASFMCLLLLPPPEGQDGEYSLWTAWLGKSSGSSSSTSSGGRIASHQDRRAGQGLLAPLLQHAEGQQRAAGEEPPVLHMEYPSGAAAGEEHHVLLPSSPRTANKRSSTGRGGSNADGAEDAAVYHQHQQPQQGQQEGETAEQEEERVWDFLRDGLDFLCRSLVLQLTFFAALAAASRLGTSVLAAHSIVSQLWILLSNVVDGLAAAGIVLGSRLAGLAAEAASGAAARASAQRLVRRLALAGLVLGLLVAAVFWAGEGSIIRLFTRHAEVAGQLSGWAWVVLTASQPLNACVFVYDGLLYAAQGFAFIRKNFVSGFFLIFWPLLAWELLSVQSLWAIWFAKAAFNVWRLGGALMLIHGTWLQQF